MVVLRQAISGFLDPKHLGGRAIAKAIGVSTSDWTNMQSGRRPVSPDRLSALVKHINYGIEPDIFRWPLPEFKAWLRDNKKGNFGDRREDRPIWALRKHVRPMGRDEVFEIVRVAPRGGLGTVADLAEAVPALHVGDQATIRVSVPPGGSCLVLTEHLASGEVTAIAPSPLYPAVRDAGDAVVKIPKRGQMRVVKPGGHYRLYAVWTAVRLSSAFLDTLEQGEPSADGAGAKVCNLTFAQIETVNDHLQRQPTSAFRVLETSYQVIE